MARWADYKTKRPEDGQAVLFRWQRIPHAEEVVLDIPAQTNHPLEKEVPGSGGLKIAISVRPVFSEGKEGGIPKGTRSVSIFLVNRRKPSPDDIKDEAFAFQAQLEVRGNVPFVARPNLRSLESDDWDERVADLQPLPRRRRIRFLEILLPLGPDLPPPQLAIGILQDQAQPLPPCAELFRAKITQRAVSGCRPDSARAPATVASPHTASRPAAGGGRRPRGGPNPS